MTDLTEDRHHEILNEIGTGTRTDLDDLEDFRCPGEWASELIAAAFEQNWEAVHLPCQVDGNLNVRLNVDHFFDFRLSGNLRIGGVGGDLVALMPLDGDLTVDRNVGGSLALQRVDGDLWVGEVNGDLSVVDVGGDLTVHRNVGGSLHALMRVGGDLRVGEASMVFDLDHVGGDMHVSDVGGDLTVLCDVGGYLWVGNVGGDMGVDGVGGDMTVDGAVAGTLHIRRGVRQVLNFTGSAREVELKGRFDGPVFLQPQSHTSLSLIRAAQFKDDVVIGDNLEIENAKFENCVGLENFRFIGSYADSFPSNRGVVSRGGSTKGCSNEMDTSTKDRSERYWNELASVNRRFRVAVEGQHNRPAASMFYRAEMVARRHAAWRETRRWPEAFVLAGYRWMSGYGTRAWLALVWFVVVGLLGAMFLYGDSGISHFEWFLFSVRTMISFFDPPQVDDLKKGLDLNTEQETVRLILRLAGPVLLAQFVLAVRDRVAR